MTVIAWDGKEMASDSLSSMGTKRFSYCQKLYRMKSGAVLGTAGDGDAREIMALLDNCETEADLPHKHQLTVCRTNFQGLLWLPDKTLWEVCSFQDEYDSTVWHGYVDQIKEKTAVAGCGGDNAQGVLDHGGTAVEAVKAAIKRDLYCGGKIQRMTLEAKKPAKKPRRRAKAARPEDPAIE